MSFGRRKAYSEIRGVKDIYVRRAILEEEDPNILVEDVSDYVGQMLGWFYRRDELPEEALRSHAVHQLVGQVVNGGGSQFVRNGKWLPEQVELVRSGLRDMQATDALEWFEWLADEVESCRSELPRFCASGGAGDLDIRERLDQRDKDFYAINQASPIVEQNWAYLKDLPNLRPLSDADFSAKMYELVESVPDYERRSAEGIYVGHPHNQMERLLYRRVRQRFHRYLQIGRIVDLDTRVSANTVVLTSGAHEVHLHPEKAELHRLEEKQVLAAITLAELTVARARGLH